MTRIPGPLCVCSVGYDWIDQGTNALTRNFDPRLLGIGFSPETLTGTTPAQVKLVEMEMPLWSSWTPPSEYSALYDLLVANEGNVSYMYLDSKNNVTVGIGTCLPTANDAKQLRFYNRETKKSATDKEKGEEYTAILAAAPDRLKYPKGRPASHYRQFTKLEMTPTDIGARWLHDVKQFQRQLPRYFLGFSEYPADAKQALTDIAYQYGAKGAAVNAARGKLKESAETGDWAAAAALCLSLQGQPARNRKRKELFEAAATVAPVKKS